MPSLRAAWVSPSTSKRVLRDVKTRVYFFAANTKELSIYKLINLR
jgi:hypothetical protein